MSWIGVGIAGAGTVASLWGTHKQNKNKEEAQADYQKQQQGLINSMNNDYSKQNSQLSEWYTKNNIGYLDTAEAQGTITRLKDTLQEQNQMVDSNSAITGATNGASIAQKKATQGNMANTMNSLAGRGTQYKNQIDNQYFLRNQALQGFKNQINQNTSNMYGSQLQGANDQANGRLQSWQNFTGNLSNLGGGMAGAFGGGGFSNALQGFGA